MKGHSITTKNPNMEFTDDPKGEKDSQKTAVLLVLRLKKTDQSVLWSFSLWFWPNL